MGEKVKRLHACAAEGQIKHDTKATDGIDHKRAESVLPILAQILGGEV
jgi:hypothetical protein